MPDTSAQLAADSAAASATSAAASATTAATTIAGVSTAAASAAAAAVAPATTTAVDAAADAIAARTGAEAARDGAVAIVGPVDATVEGLVKNTGGVGPLTSAALSATYGAGKNAAENIAGAKTFTSLSGLRSSTWFGIGAGVGSARNPFYQNSLLDGNSFVETLAAGGGDDYVGHQINVSFQGGFDHLMHPLTASMTSGSTTVNLSAGSFNAVPIAVGFYVFIPGAGTGGGLLRGKITSIASNTQATIDTAAGTTVSNVATSYASLAPDPTFLFAANDFFRSGSTAGDLDGIANIFGRLMEMHIYTPGATLGTVKATSSEAAIEASATGTTIGTVMGHHVKAIVNRGTATVTNSYGLYVEENTTANATNVYSIFSNGGRNRLDGRSEVRGKTSTDVPLKVFNALSTSVNMVEGWDVTGTNRSWRITNLGGISTNVDLTAREGGTSPVSIGNVSGGFAGIRLGNADAELRRTSSGVVEALAKWRWTAANVQTTVGAAGAASALPATPSKYLKVVGDDGTTYVIPAYTA